MKKRFITAVLLMVACVSQLTVSVLAVSTIPDLTRPCSLTIEMKYEGVNIPNAQIAIYHVADTVMDNGDMTLVLTTGFGGFTGDLAAIETTEGNQALAVSLRTYASNNGVAPAAGHIQVTGTGGKVSFTNLKAGLYLVLTGYVAGYRTIAPYMLMIPTSPDLQTWTYDVFAEPKTEIIPTATPTATPTPPPGGGSTPPPPTTQTPRPTATPTPTPTTTPTTATPGPTSTPTAPTTTTPGPTSTPLPPSGTPSPTEKPDMQEVIIPKTEEPGTVTPGRPSPGLPQTGLLMWPIPVMAVAGVLLFVGGWVGNKKQKTKGEQ